MLSRMGPWVLGIGIVPLFVLRSSIPIEVSIFPRRVSSDQACRQVGVRWVRTHSQISKM